MNDRSPDRSNRHVRDAGDSRAAAESLHTPIEPARDPKQPTVYDSRANVADADASRFGSAHQPPSRLGRFEVQRFIAGGGMGEVSQARDLEVERDVAVKILRRDGPSGSIGFARFQREAAIIARLEHPSILPIYGRGLDEHGQPFYAMRLVDGETFRHHIRDFHDRVAGGLEEFNGGALRHWIRRWLDVCDAVGYAHACGIIHRDLKPSNVMIGEFGQTFVVDWGLAKRLDEDDPTQHRTTFSKQTFKAAEIAPVADQPNAMGEANRHGPIGTPATTSPSSRPEIESTLPGSVVGTPEYASPEQLAGDSDAMDERSDVFGLTGILYELLTGEPPRPWARDRGTGKRLRQEPIRPAQKMNAAVPASLDSICRRGLAHQPEARYATATELSADVQAWLDGQRVQAHPDRWLDRSGRWLRRHRVVASVAVAVLVVGAFASMVGSVLVAEKNRSLQSANRRLDAKNRELASAHSAETRLREDARQQSELAMAAMGDAILFFQRAARDLPNTDASRRQFLEASLQRLEKLSTEFFDASRADATKVVAMLDMAELILTSRLEGPSETGSNRFELAENLVRRAIDLSEKRLQAEPTELESHRRLARAVDTLANVQFHQGKLRAAARESSKCLAICDSAAERFVGASPDETFAIRSDSAKYQSRLGRIYLELGDVDRAERLFREALVTRRWLGEQRGERVSVQHVLFFAFEHLASVAAFRGDTDVALRWLGDAEAIADRLAGDQRVSALESRWPAYVDQLCGQVLLDAGRLDEAEDRLRDALSQRLQLSDAEPRNLIVARDLSFTENSLGQLALIRGNDADAMSHFERSLEATAKFAVDLSGHTMDLQNRLEAAIGRADAARRLGDPAKAMRFAQAATKVAEGMFRRSPESVLARGEYAKALLCLANVQREAAAADHWNDGRRVTATSDHAGIEGSRLAVFPDVELPQAELETLRTAAQLFEPMGPEVAFAAVHQGILAAIQDRL